MQNKHFNSNVFNKYTVYIKYCINIYAVYVVAISWYSDLGF
jgi:hypothetical protein